jgi:hypothetical protein
MRSVFHPGGTGVLAELPSINFNEFFNAEPASYQLEKFRCFLHYFERMGEKIFGENSSNFGEKKNSGVLHMNNHNIDNNNNNNSIPICVNNGSHKREINKNNSLVSFHRVSLQGKIEWSEILVGRKLTELILCPRGKIEDKTELLQIDFANKYIGGGVLGWFFYRQLKKKIFFF